MKTVYVYGGKFHNDPKLIEDPCEYVIRYRTARQLEAEELQGLMLRMLEPGVLESLNDTSIEVLTRQLYTALMECPKYKNVCRSIYECPLYLQSTK